MQRPTSRLASLAVLAALVALAAVLAAGCGGGGGGGGEDPQKVLDETFASGKDYSKGVVDLSLKFAAEGDEAGSLDAAVKGPFQGTEGAFPKFDFDADINVEGSGQSAGFQGGLLSTGEKAYVNFQGTDYEVDAPTFNNFKQLYISLQSQGAEDQPSALNPAEFLVDLKNDGTEDVEGTETIHISGKADIAKLVEQVQAAPGAADAPGADQLEQLKTSVSSADFDIYSGADDKALRKIDANVVFEPPPEATGGNTSTITANFSLTFSDLGQEQTVTEPAEAKPLAELLQQYGLDSQGLDQALGTSGAAAGAAGGAGATGADTGAGAGSNDGAASAAPAPPSDSEAAAYLECLGNAQGQEAIQACDQ